MDIKTHYQSIKKKETVKEDHVEMEIYFPSYKINKHF